MHLAGSTLIKRGWLTFKEHFLYLWALFAILIGASVFFSLLEKAAGGPDSAWGGIIRLVSLLVLFLLQLGLLHVLIHLVRSGEELGVEELFSQRRIYLRALLGTLCYYLLVAAGLLFFIIPGIYFAVRYYFLQYFYVDTDASFEEGFRRAAGMTRGKMWHFLGFFILLFALNMLGFLLLVVGLAVTIPVTALAVVHAYVAMGTSEPEKDETEGDPEAVSREEREEKPRIPGKNEVIPLPEG
jgi:hypothetical protein